LAVAWILYHKKERREVINMWLCDLEKALGTVIAFLGADACAVCVESVKPCADGGIVFKTTCHTYIKWFPNGETRERNEEDWRK
jgi:hypothetical protein